MLLFVIVSGRKEVSEPGCYSYREVVYIYHKIKEGISMNTNIYTRLSGASLCLSMLIISGCYHCGGLELPCPPNTPPTDEACRLVNAPWPAGGCKGIEGSRGCPKYYTTTLNLATYPSQCVKTNLLGGSERIIYPGDPDYGNCPTCDASQCSVMGYWVLAGLPCEERSIIPDQCLAPCVYSSYAYGNPPA